MMKAHRSCGNVGKGDSVHSNLFLNALLLLVIGSLTPLAHFPLEPCARAKVRSMFLVFFFLAIIASVASTALDDYVWTPDSHYEWTDLNQPISGTSPSGVSWTGHLLNVTSQQWLTPDDVDR